MNADRESEVVVHLIHGVGDLSPRLESLLFAFLLVLVVTFGLTRVAHWFGHYWVRRHHSGRYVGGCGVPLLRVVGWWSAVIRTGWASVPGDEGGGWHAFAVDDFACLFAVTEDPPPVGRMGSVS
jgi:hypothetical protein